jgi:hypothetical protein
MDIEKTGWFRAGVSALTIASAVGLFYWAGVWPFGSRSIAAGVIFFFCLVGLQRFFAGVLGIAAIYLTPGLPGAAPKT